MFRAERLLAFVAGLLLISCTTDWLGNRPSEASVAGRDELTEEPSPVGEPAPAPSLEESLPNVLEERADVPVSQVDAQLNEAFLQLFFGDPATEAVFFDQGDGTAYIMDIANGDVRTDSMAYGLLTTVQLDQRDVFDKLWAWTKTYMRSPDGPSAGILRWRCDTTGEGCDAISATDASSIIATALFMAESRWGDAGSFDYRADALSLLDTLVGIEERNGGVVDDVHNSFDIDAALPRNGSYPTEERIYVDYLMPAFYEVWAERDSARADFWRQVAANSRELLFAVSDASTGLLPGEVDHDGAPHPENDWYGATTARALLNLALDHHWYGPHEETVAQNGRLLDFFLEQGIDQYVASYTLSGEVITPFNTTAHRSLVALAAGTTQSAAHDPFIDALWVEPIPTGTYRYYDGMLYMLSLLVLSGQVAPP